MDLVRSKVALSALVITAVLVAACGGNASLSPVGPSATSAGASISGTVSGSAVSVSRIVGSDGTFNLLETPRGVTVTIVGTGISTTADNQGQFTLNNVPAGTVQLNFSGAGSNATVTLTGIGPNDKVQITVTVNGNSARVDSEHHSSPDNNKREFQGRITSIDAGAKTFQIPGMTIKVTPTTVLRHGDRTFQFADLKVGDHVEARGTKDGTTLTATEVKIEGDNDDDENEDDDRGAPSNQTSVTGQISGSTGTCPAVTFMVGSTKVAVNTSTTYPQTSCGDATKNGAKVKVVGTKQNDVITASSVSLAP